MLLSLPFGAIDSAISTVDDEISDLNALSHEAGAIDSAISTVDEISDLQAMLM